MRFNSYINSHFAGCRLLAEGFDNCRSRAVRAYLLPGYHTDVGFSDGTDAWIVPLAAESCTGSGNLMRGVDLRALVGQVLNGESPAVARMLPPPRRRAVLDAAPADPAPAPAGRRRLALDDQPQLFPQPQAETSPRRRHVSI